MAKLVITVKSKEIEYNRRFMYSELNAYTCIFNLFYRSLIWIILQINKSLRKKESFLPDWKEHQVQRWKNWLCPFSKKKKLNCMQFALYLGVLSMSVNTWMFQHPGCFSTLSLVIRKASNISFQFGGKTFIPSFSFNIFLKCLRCKGSFSHFYSNDIFKSS